MAPPSLQGDGRNRKVSSGKEGRRERGCSTAPAIGNKTRESRRGGAHFTDDMSTLACIATRARIGIMTHGGCVGQTLPAGEGVTLHETSWHEISGQPICSGKVDCLRTLKRCYTSSRPTSPCRRSGPAGRPGARTTHWIPRGSRPAAPGPSCPPGSCPHTQDP